MKTSSTGEKPRNLIDLLSGSDSVKVTTKGTTVGGATGNNQALSNTPEEKATSIKLGLAKYLADELDSGKVLGARQAKIDEIKAKLANGASSYFESINSESLGQKILEEAQLENLIVSKAANEE